MTRLRHTLSSPRLPPTSLLHILILVLIVTRLHRLVINQTSWSIILRVIILVVLIIVFLVLVLIFIIILFIVPIWLKRRGLAFAPRRAFRNPLTHHPKRQAPRERASPCLVRSARALESLHQPHHHSHRLHSDSPSLFDSPT